MHDELDIHTGAANPHSGSAASGANSDITGLSGITSTAVVTNLNADQVDGKDETDFVLLAGRAGGQNIIGGTGAAENLILESTSNATKGNVQFGTSGNTYYSETNDNIHVGLGTLTNPSIAFGDGDSGFYESFELMILYTL